MIPSTGVEYVVVNGRVVVNRGELVEGVLAGSAVRGELYQWKKSYV